MKRFERSPEPASGFGELLREGMVLTGGALLRSPVLVGGATVFIVTMGFVTANALWYQPHFHDGAFFETRSIIRLVPETDEPARPAPPQRRVEAAPARSEVKAPRAEVAQEMPADIPIPASLPRSGTASVVEQVQRRLAELNLYAGDVDGLDGPQTNAAIEHYRQIVGIPAGGGIDSALLSQLGIDQPSEAPVQAPAPEMTASIQNAPIPLPRASAIQQPAPRKPGRQPELATATAEPDARIMRIQAGLRAFGNDGIELDGKVGKHTKDALREFQALFGLPETGEPDEVTYVKMREIGLTN